jgi:hypothetical protein
MRHALRMGTHAERDYFIRGRSLFDTVIVNANLMEATRDATSVLLVRLKRPYLIDPITYAFALDPVLLRSATQPKERDAEPRPRATFGALAEAYGLPIAGAIGRTRLKPSDFNEETFPIVVDRVMQYQSGIVMERLSKNAEFIGASLDQTTIAAPQGLIPPYFVDDFSGSWRELNLAALNQAAQTRKDQAVGMVAYDSGSSSLHNTQVLAIRLLETGVQQFIIWPADLDEHVAPISLLEPYVELVTRLSSAGRRVWAAYGGFFAIMMRFRGIEGLSHGLGYGDKRQMEPVTGGGLPPATYYAKPVRDTVSIGTLSVLVDGLTEAEYRQRICSCAICEGLLKYGGVPGLLKALSETDLRASAKRGMVEVTTPRVYRLSRFHYLLNRAAEVAWLDSGVSFHEVESTLKSDAEWASNRIGEVAVRHIPRWLQVTSQD